MEKIIMLGTGHAMVTKCFNTCFALSIDDQVFLVDSGGGNTILTNLEKTHLSLNRIHHMFISHNHSDHVLGSIWIIRGIAHEIIRGNYQGNLNIYCHKSSVKAIKSICSYVLTKNILKIINNRIKFFKIKDGYKTSLLGKKIEFFDIHSTKDIQFGFQIMLEEEKKLTFLGDEPYRASVKKYCENTDYLLHEAFCLYSQREIYKPYEKHHSTAKDACRNAKVLNVKNIILYHTEDDNLKDRKHFYIQEGKEVFKGNIYMPDDLDVIEISNSNGC